MRLTIESEFAPSSSVGARFTGPEFVNGAVRLDVCLEKQHRRNWCWAAIASALGRYYGTSGASQDEIASRALASDSSRGDERAEVDEANVEFRLDRALQAAGCFSHWSAGKPVFERIRFEINMGRPLGARIEWHHGGAHYVVIHGYRDEGELVLVGDSQHGPGEYALSRFPSLYREGGAWTETFWTSRGGTTKAEDLER
ncbi:MAG TPA: papain-like cysteine protease family protein [Terracidiphilus sp.]|nr:papain-like cysteine protease family protein [Terracidiphilus sp.]